jgi:hypothetical protein
MICDEIKTTVRTLQAQGRTLREISRLLKLSRNSVRRILRSCGAREFTPPCDEATRVLLRTSFERARGNVVRAQALLKDVQGKAIAYSTLTRWVREEGLRPAPKRSGEYHFGPGEEMQHDTSPHKLTIAGKMLSAQCAALVLAYSRKLFMQYYPRFTRFEAKCFLLDAVRFMDGACPRCVIDNTSVIVAAGSGMDAVFAPEMAAFARTLGFVFMAHRVNDPNRKGRIEKPFDYVEGNFLPGRSFSDFDDLNHQALAWCRDVANQKPKRILGMSPEAAYLMEKPHLQSLPIELPPVYESFERTVDGYGFVSVETNRYSAPERFIGRSLTVYKYGAEIQLFYRGTKIAAHPRLIGKRDAKHTIAGHHATPQRVARSPAPEAAVLRGQSEILDCYVEALVSRAHGRGVRQLRRLIEMKRMYPPEPFLAAISQALDFGLYDLGRLEALILKKVAGDFFNLDSMDEDNA